MRLDDLLNPKTGPEALMRLSLYPFLILVIGDLAMPIVNHLTAADFLVAVLFLMLVSPAAYAIRERRQRSLSHVRNRRGAERTPVLPQHEEDDNDE